MDARWRIRPAGAGPIRMAGVALALLMGAGAGAGEAAVPVAQVAQEAPAAEPAAPRRQALVRMVRQDCGSCHGMQLTGGLGPALTREALADKSTEGLAITIYQGRLGTPMPGWRTMLSEPEAQWIAERLVAGFPQEGAR